MSNLLSVLDGNLFSLSIHLIYYIKHALLYYIYCFNLSKTTLWCFLVLNPEGSHFLESGCKITAFVWTDQIFSHFFSIFFVRG